MFKHHNNCPIEKNRSKRNYELKSRKIANQKKCDRATPSVAVITYKGNSV